MNRPETKMEREVNMHNIEQSFLQKSKLSQYSYGEGHMG
jgi:hypothetical protein